MKPTISLSGVQYLKFSLSGLSKKLDSPASDVLSPSMKAPSEVHPLLPGSPRYALLIRRVMAAISSFEALVTVNDNSIVTKIMEFVGRINYKTNLSFLTASPGRH